MDEGLDKNVLDGYRDLILLRLGQVSVVLFTPFCITNFLTGKLLLGFGTLLVLSTLLVNGVAVMRKRPPILSPFWTAVPTLLCEMLGVHMVGMRGLFWHFPALIFYFFVQDRPGAMRTNLVMTGILTPWLMKYQGARLGARFLAASLMTSIFCNVFVKLIEHLQDQLRAQAVRDPLTGAYNRRHMDDCLKTALERNRRHQVDWSLLIMDLDHFKRINDELGHDAGDQVLRKAVETVSGRIRRLDTLFRAGGEEFVILLESAGPHDALQVADQLCQIIAAAAMLEGRQVTASIGAAGLSPDDTVESWMRRADESLYDAKSSGRNRAVCKELVSSAAD